MLLTRTVTKKILENIVHETFTKFGNLSSSSLLDSLKFLGFYYATNAGISINIEDLKTPDVKKTFLTNANSEISKISEDWQQGFVSDTERFQTIIDVWNIVTESLKNRIIDYYQNYDPANNLYIMAFSGARGNMSQVRQLVGMRGLMSDQEGKIIDLPIQTNFREGLSSIDYIISSYGARKGIVDTALKTADSGYLTRRLIYLAQDLVIREFDCKTKQGIVVFLNKKSSIKNLIGRSFLSTKDSPFETIIENKILDETQLKELRKRSPLKIIIRSSLTCESNGSICQKCYGWDLAKEKLISLGEAVGIIAAQSIGEPGTQLTMRTFHTGGIFTGETMKQIFSPFSGKLIIPSSLKSISYRTSHGSMVLKIQEETKLILMNWKGEETEIFLKLGSFLSISVTQFVKKDQVIGEYSTESFLAGIRKLKPIYTPISGEIKFENLLLRKIPLKEDVPIRIIKVNQDDGVLWIASGKIFPFPKEIDYYFPDELKKEKTFAKLKLVSPFSGVVKLIEKNQLLIFGSEKTIFIDLNNIVREIANCSMKFSPLIKNYQWIDSHTILGNIEFYPNYEGRIYSLRKKDAPEIQTLFCITESDIWKINSDHVNDFSFFQTRKTIVRAGNVFNSNSNFSRSGYFLKKDGFQMIFQNALPIFLTRGTILNYKQGDFVFEKKVFASLVNYTQQTEDIVQGLPKIEELIEARKPKTKCFLANRPGIIFRKLINGIDSESFDFERMFEKGVIKCIYAGNGSSKNSLLKLDALEQEAKEIEKEEGKKQSLLSAQSIYMKENIVVFRNKIFQVIPIPNLESFDFIQKETLSKYEKELVAEKKGKDKRVFYFKSPHSQFLFHGKKNCSSWVYAKNIRKRSKKTRELLKKYKKGTLENWISLKSQNVFTNRKKDFLIKFNNFGRENFLFLQYLNPMIRYEFPISLKIIVDSGSFIDLGEPITEGIIDVHELLNILFQYHSVFDGILNGTIRSLTKFQLILVNSIQAIYQSQGVNISSKHIEIIVKQMTSKVLIKESGDTPLLPGEIVKWSFVKEISKALNQNGENKVLKYEPMLISATNTSLSKDGFLSAAGFQETKRVLTKAAIEGCCDWLRGLKECIIVGRLIPAGSTFLNYKNYLDSVYLYKDEKRVKND